MLFYENLSISTETKYRSEIKSNLTIPLFMIIFLPKILTIVKNKLMWVLLINTKMRSVKK